MNKQLINKLVGTVELVVGSLVVSSAIWSYMGVYRCPENTSDCEAWAVLTAYLIGPIGFFVALTGFVQLKSKRYLSQLLLIPAAAWLTFFVSQ